MKSKSYFLYKIVFGIFSSRSVIYAVAIPTFHIHNGLNSSTERPTGKITYEIWTLLTCPCSCLNFKTPRVQKNSPFKSRSLSEWKQRKFYQMHHELRISQRAEIPFFETW